MTDAAVPHAGEVEAVPEEDAAEIVEELAEETEHHPGSTPRLLIALDIDGTVLLEDETLSPGVVEAVEHARRAGHEVMLATGRSWASTRGVVRVLEIEPDYVVCSNGTVILKKIEGDEVRYEQVHTETFDATEVVTLLREHLPDAKYMVELEDGSRLYTEELDDWNLLGARRVAFDELTREPVCRVVVVSPDHAEGDFVDLVAQVGLNEVSYAIGWTAWLDIAPPGIDKSTALEMVREWLGFDPHEVLVIGDGRNDLGMFAWALENGGRAIAMAQGPQEVLDAAGEITSSVHEGGVAAILRAL
ncbi:MAG TPA: haloacid dehalogenase [Microbacterium sp.]|uniref:HAD family hydrolase n=1 Tax=unclassified Microbacterium TaxID=2609290 RepID=UPI000C40BF3E|nr:MULTISPECIES: HAD family hydrolase [unclassified Microbacterium]MBU19921.1 haloacid dehalogenase [Microbacterium sp.]HAJ17173.1 haloacid dehalogenase [Microbacterium sp.]HAM12127.1 haloacid dehalogenase [Microbacterium sp.]HBS09507.1 haloacid dehalogenase [Microbacterium sp.]HBU42886.1 haloacid dehalogenase [Microbacterium sp.]